MTPYRMTPTQNEEDAPSAWLPPHHSDARRSCDDNESDSGSVLSQNNLTAAKLQEIKARTMYQMVEELPGIDGSQPAKLLFLTNAQATVLASSEQMVKRMVDSLELPTPNLVINLLMSRGSEATAYNLAFEHYNQGGNMGSDVTEQYDGAGPFLNAKEQRAALSRLDRFMSEILIPLAASTRAVILISHLPQLCMLTRSLLKMVAIKRAKWKVSSLTSTLNLSDHLLPGRPALLYDFLWCKYGRDVLKQ